MTQQYHDIIEECMENFDFQKVHSIMKTLDWKWFKPNSPDYEIPGIYRIMSFAKNMLEDLVEKSVSEKQSLHSSSGGFTASVLWNDEENKIAYVKLAFELESWISENDCKNHWI